jgi:hypothetical protein
MALADGRALPIARVMSAMEDRGYALALLFLAFPFVLPIPSLGCPRRRLLPGLTGLALARGGTPSLPGFLSAARSRIPRSRPIAAAVARARRGERRLVRPRLAPITSGPARAAIGLSLPSRP